jgi:hypothetical protein
MVSRAVLGTAVHHAICDFYRTDAIRAANRTFYGETIPGHMGMLFPDIRDFTLGEVAEIKPLTPYGIVTGVTGSMKRGDCSTG